MYKLELHSHSHGVSRCAKADPEVVIARYREAGYQGLVSTNHINNGTYQDHEEWSWEKKAEYLLNGFCALKKAAGDELDVLLGCEINLHTSGPNDYLIFGVTEDWLMNLGDPRDLSLKELSEKVRAAGMMIIQAHPFRYGSVIMRDELLDGVEIFNGNPSHDSHNYLSALWAERRHLIAISGSDFHNPQDPVCGGILTRKRIRDNGTLLNTLRSGDYGLILKE